MTPEERKALREKYSIHDKDGETIYRHYGDLDGADFKLLKNKNCEIYILDWSKGMFIDECENCTIVCGPIDGSVFIRKCKNCKISLIARQVRFRDSENVDIFTYVPSDPVVESCFNIFFGPFNAFFPHLIELFQKGGFNSEEKNHIDTPYDFTPSEVLGGGLPHYSPLPEERFYIKIIRDGEAPLEEMFKGYSEKEKFLVNKASELPKFGEKIVNNNNNINIDDFGFGDNEPKETLNNIITNNDNNNNTQKDNNLMTMDDFISSDNNNTNTNKNINNINNQNNNMFDFGAQNNNNTVNNNNTNINFDNFNFGTNNNDTKQDFNNNNNNNNIMFDNNFNTNPQQDSFNTYEISKQKMTKEMEEEIRLEQIREKTKQIRQERIKALMEKEAKLKKEIFSKAMEYMNQFYTERKKKIEENHQKLLQKEQERNMGNNSGNLWQNISSDMTGSSSSADRMREAIMNKSKQEQNK